MRSRDRIAIGYTDPGTVDGRFASALFGLGVNRGQLFTTLIHQSGSMLARQRNMIAAQFLDQTNAAWLLMLDADVVLSIEAFDLLCATVHDQTRPVVSGLYFALGHGEPWPRPVPTLYRIDAEGNHVPIFDYPANSIIEVESAGAGCLIVHRSVLEAIRRDRPIDVGPEWCWFHEGPYAGGEGWIGEDLTFCNRIRAAGYPIHAHTGAVLPHHKAHWIAEAQYRANL